MARRPPLTLQQRALHAQQIAWGFIIGSSIIGAMIASEVAHRLLPHRG